MDAARLATTVINDFQSAALGRNGVILARRVGVLVIKVTMKFSQNNLLINWTRLATVQVRPGKRPYQISC